MRNLLTHPVVVWTSRIVVAVVFLVYGGSKIPNLAAFAVSINNYRILPIELVNIVAVTLPWIEVMAAVAILGRRFAPGGILLIGGMTATFIAMIASALIRGLDIDCGCFTLSAESETYNNLWQHLLLDIGLLAMAVHLWWAGIHHGDREKETAS